MRIARPGDLSCVFFKHFSNIQQYSSGHHGTFLYQNHAFTVEDKITDIKSDAAFVLLVEKEAAYMRMAEDRFYHKYPCIIITAKGQPDVAR